MNLAIAAGLMEGEGSVRINSPTKRNTGHLVVAMSNTNIQLVEWMNNQWPEYCKSVKGLREVQKPAWCWTIASRKALAFLKEIEPYIITDRMRERIKAAKWWQSMKSKHWMHRTEEDSVEQFSCFIWMAHLNARGRRYEQPIEKGPRRQDPTRLDDRGC